MLNVLKFLFTSLLIKCDVFFQTKHHLIASTQVRKFHSIEAKLAVKVKEVQCVAGRNYMQQIYRRRVELAFSVGQIVSAGQMTSLAVFK